MKQAILKYVFACVVCLAAPFVSAAPTSGVAPDFSLPSNQGAPISLSSLKGQVVMVNFWASWCGPCREEFPLMEDIYKRYKPVGFTILAVNIDTKQKHAEKMLGEVPVTFPVVFDTKNKISEQYELESMPSTFMVDRKGKIRFMHRGYKPGFEQKYEEEIRALLKE